MAMVGFLGGETETLAGITRVYFLQMMSVVGGGTQLPNYNWFQAVTLFFLTGMN